MPIFICTIVLCKNLMLSDDLSVSWGGGTKSFFCDLWNYIELETDCHYKFDFVIINLTSVKDVLNQSSLYKFVSKDLLYE